MKLKTKHIQLFEDFINDIEDSENEDELKPKKKTQIEDEEGKEEEEEDLVAEFERHFKTKKN